VAMDQTVAEMARPPMISAGAIAMPRLNVAVMLKNQARSVH
jgi:hypothetical protein